MRLSSLLAVLALTSCTLVHERDVDAGPSGPDAARADAVVVDAPSHLLWVLVHPSDAPLGPGLFQFDESTQQIVSRLPLPDGVTSPHGLAWDGDGASLWMSDFGASFSGPIYRLDPTNGAVLSRIPAQTEGIAFEGDTIWYASAYGGPTTQWLMHVTRAGDMLGSIPVSAVTMQGLTRANGALYYLINDDQDRIVRVDPASGAETEVTRGVDIAPSSLSFDGQSLAVALDGHIRRYDPVSGALTSDTPLDMHGWITGLAFVR